MNVFRSALLMLVWILTGCLGKDVPSSIIQPHEMGNILFEISMAEEFVNTYVAKDSLINRDTAIRKEYQKIFLLHDISEAKFKKSYDYYRSHIDVFKVMMDSLNNRSQRARNELYRASDE